VSDVVAPAEPTQTADPAMATRSGRLLIVVRGLIAFAVALRSALTIALPRSEPYRAVTQRFGSLNVASILQRIHHAICLAEALEQRILRTARSLDRKPQRPGACAKIWQQPAQTAPEPSKPERAATEARHRVRQKSIGALIAEICAELEIINGDRLWLPVVAAVAMHRGPALKMIRDMLTRVRRTGYFITHPAWPAPDMPPDLAVAICARPP
jgi:hypothetical protein